VLSFYKSNGRDVIRQKADAYKHGNPDTNEYLSHAATPTVTPSA
jgi:hypothetical protein